MKRPMVGVVPLYDEEKESLWMIPGYMDGIIGAGGMPVMLPLTDREEILLPLLAQCDGILLTGGQDVAPDLYGEEKTAECGESCVLRDRMERILLEYAVEKDKAVLGICRGIQFMNAAMGGSLYQDLPTQKPSPLEHHQTPPYDVPVHEVDIVEDSPLYALLQEKRIAVNSYHHQAVRGLSPAFQPMAYATDGIVEAIAMPDKRFVWGIQWHPELSYRSDQKSRLIFEKFIAACR